MPIGPARMVYDLEYFRKLPLYTGWKDHNVALKFMREECEARAYTVIFIDSIVPVAEIEHDKGTSFRFLPGKTHPWEWQQMVAQLTEDSMRTVVQGVEGRSRGIVSCSLQQTPQYDHKRHHAERTKGEHTNTQYHIWDFVLTRDDESFVALHPQYSKTKVECKEHWPKFDGELPKTGLGGTGLDGRDSNRGTYQHFIRKDVDRIVRFDAKKNVAPQSRVQWTHTSSSDGPALPGSGGASSSGLWQ